MSQNTGSQPGPYSPFVVNLAWLAVVVGVVGNAVASFAADAIVVQLALSSLTAVGIGTLVLNWLRRR
ncbi:hypothetical protein [Kineosporia babensis]|uniref:Uncharacterized protein n=1 Tax=Kineosporia babensis TaxID=499548 RepID=A0A9X1NF45_9ACTN|nr:hypothetical protein [Kineosporia babensis]MCD5312646.1 hypothetical protein [Kineosporia babensis]